MNSPCIESLGSDRYRCRNQGWEFRTTYLPIRCGCELPSTAITQYGVGYFLSLIIKILFHRETKKCRCRSWIMRLNDWGPKESWKKRREVISHLMEEVHKQMPRRSRIPGARLVAYFMLLLACGLEMWRRYKTGEYCPSGKGQLRKQTLATMFEMVYVINLDRSTERYKDFCIRIPKDWPFVKIQRFSAVDGNKVPVPTWWKGLKGAWGCFLSHKAVIEKCLNEGIQSVLLLEDDAVFCEDFTEKMKKLFSELPKNWEVLYLGGNHLKRREAFPQPFSESLSEPHNVNGTFGWALQGNGLRKVYEYLISIDWPRAHTIDHHMGYLIENKGVKAFAATPFLIGHNQGNSDITKTAFKKVNFFQLPTKAKKVNKPVKTQEMPTVIAVIGPFRSGTSAVAGTLHHLGIPMGRNFHTPKPSNPKGFYEAVMLTRMCRNFYKEPYLIENKMFTQEQRIQQLQQWALSRSAEGKIIGAKHPTLCVMIPEIVQAWPKLKIIRVDRPIEESQNSIRKWQWWAEKAIQEVIPSMVNRRNNDLLSINNPVLAIAYSDLLDRPDEIIGSIIEFCEIHPSRKQREEAIKFIDPSLRHFNSSSLIPV